MKGQILDFSIQNNEGVITGENGERYKFSGSEWKGNVTPQRGINVDFDIVESGQAVEVYIALGAKGLQKQVSGEVKRTTKNKTTYLLLTFFLGGFGIHKFYMGSWGWGILYILGSIFFLSAIVSLIEFIRFLFISQEDFDIKAEEFENSNPGPFGFFW